MGAVVWTLLGLLCLLLAPAGASQEGEVCLVWLQGPITGLLLFRCPQRPDGTDGPFCCGTCLAPYCCDSKKASLDQDQYHCLYAWKMLTVFVGATVARKEKAALPVWPVLGTTTPTPQPQPRPKTALIDTVLAVIILVMAIAVVVIMCIWKWPQLIGLHQHENDALTEFPMVVPSDPRPLDPPGEVYDPPPPYEERPSLPTYSQVAPYNCSHGEDSGATTAGPWRPALTGHGSGPQRPALTGRGTEEAATQAATQAPTTSGTTSHTGPTDAPAAAGEVTPELGAAAAGDMTPKSRAAIKETEV